MNGRENNSWFLIQIQRGLSYSTTYALPSSNTCISENVAYATPFTLDTGRVFIRVSTASSMGSPSLSSVPRILELMVANMFALTPLPIPSARMSILESLDFVISTISPQSSSPK